MVTGGAADHLALVYQAGEEGGLELQHRLAGHSGHITSIALTQVRRASLPQCSQQLCVQTAVVTGSRDCCINIWCLATGQLQRSLPQDGEVTAALCLFCSALYSRSPA